MKRMLASLATVLGALAVTPGMAAADPNPFGSLGCACNPVAGIPADQPDIEDQVDQGIQNGLGSMHHLHHS